MELHSRIGVDGVASWWAFLCAVGLLNIAAWALSLVLIKRRQTSMPLGHYTVCRSQLLLSAVYVFGCAFRSALPVFDVPMYLSRWLADEASGRQYLSFWQGLMDVTQRRVASHRWEDWKTEVMWMSLYFSVAVWISFFLIHAAARVLRRDQTKMLRVVRNVRL